MRGFFTHELHIEKIEMRPHRDHHSQKASHQEWEKTHRIRTLLFLAQSDGLLESLQRLFRAKDFRHHNDRSIGIRRHHQIHR